MSLEESLNAMLVRLAYVSQQLEYIFPRMPRGADLETYLVLTAQGLSTREALDAIQKKTSLRAENENAGTT